MEKFIQKYTIVQLLEDLKEGDTFSVTTWPLHVTLADIFAINLASEEISTLLSDVATQHEPFETTADHIEQFGPNQDIEVTTINLTDQLIALHQDLINRLKSNKAIFNNPEPIGDGFKAHSTAQTDRRLEPGTRVQFSALSLIDMFPDQNGYKRRILKILPL